MKEKHKAIGVFDSGLGGLTCVAELMRLMPGEDIIYFGDTARVPYGTRSRETILEYTAQDVGFVRSKDVKLIIAACGTVSSAIGTDKALAAELAGNTPFMGVVVPAAEEACKATKNGVIGVIGTQATISSGAYEQAIHALCSDAKTVSAACPLFVPMVENGITDKDDIVVRAMTERYLSPVKASGADVLILGCTHYPHLIEAVRDYMGEGVTLVSSGAAAARKACSVLGEAHLHTDSTKGTLTCYTSDSEELFDRNAHRFIGKDLICTVNKVSVDELQRFHERT
ncbi:MAG: glutamate racemase [Oscillospiraceae bacterium]|nr:glutamate racemase [Oscillospiraceae bacterium]